MAVTEAAPQCAEITDGATVIGHICGVGPKHVYRREPAGARWCFGCRKRLLHEDVLIGDPPEAMSYYEPTWSRICSSCGRDRTAFPGMSW